MYHQPSIIEKQGVLEQELYQYTHLEPPLADKASAFETLEYLQACN